MKFIFKHIPAILFLLALLCACSPQKRINRILNRHPELKRDTVLTYYDTVKIPGFRTDTLVNWHSTRDTIIINKNNIITKVFVHKDSVFIGQTGSPRIIKKHFKVTIPRIVYEINDTKRWQFFWIGAAVLGFIIIVLVVVLFIYGPKKL